MADGHGITFERDNYHVKCDGGIETRHCLKEMSWIELEDGWHILAKLCDSCKIEVETYINNQERNKSIHQTIKSDPVLKWLEQAIENRKKEIEAKYPVKPGSLSIQRTPAQERGKAILDDCRRIIKDGMANS